MGFPRSALSSGRPLIRAPDLAPERSRSRHAALRGRRVLPGHVSVVRRGRHGLLPGRRDLLLRRVGWLHDIGFIGGDRDG
jgi:hypothetical protein